MMENIAYYLTLGCIFILWFGIMLFLTWALILGISSYSWSSVSGKIKKSDMVKVKRSETGSIATHYRTTIIYAYSVNGIEHRSQTISIPSLVWQVLNRGLHSKGVAEQMVKKYPTNAAVKVYYNPKNPRRAVLQPGILDFNFIIIFTIFSFFGVFGGVMLFVIR